MDEHFFTNQKGVGKLYVQDGALVVAEVASVGGVEGEGLGCLGGLNVDCDDFESKDIELDELDWVFDGEVVVGMCEDGLDVEINGPVEVQVVEQDVLIVGEGVGVSLGGWVDLLG